MNDLEARAAMVRYWLEKADQALVTASQNLNAGDFTAAINRAYYACFYAASAALLHEAKTFSKHSGVRSAIHQYFVRAGLISQYLGEFYDRIFDDRMEMDYQMITPPEADEIRQQIDQAEQFISAMKRLIRS